MKNTILYILSIAGLVFLTSCSSVPYGYASCNSLDGYCRPIVQKYPCKVALDRCEKICNSCTFGGPACATCWACINYANCTRSCKGCG